MIPKIIHYCWFGGNPLPELAEKCIASWRKFLPDYEIKEWNESNYDVRKITYIAQAYEAKKYAFVSDYARFDILYKYGGVYFDTDVEIIKPLDEVLSKGAFAGVECAGALNAGLGLASPAASPIYKEILDSYGSSEFLYKNGTMNLTTVVDRVSKIFLKHGFSAKNEIQFIDDITIYPAEYFCPIDFTTGILNITDKTLTIHHFAGTWTTPAQKEYDNSRYKLIHKFGLKIGRYLLFFPFIRWQLKDNGIGGVILKAFRMIIKRKVKK